MGGDTWNGLLLAAAVVKHGTQDWSAVAGELKTRISPCNFTPEVCKAKFEELQQKYSGCTVTALFEELMKKRKAELRSIMYQADKNIGSKKLEIEFLEARRAKEKDDCLVDNGSVEPELHVPLQGLDRVESTAKEMSKDGQSAESFTHETQNGQVPTMSCDDKGTNAEVSASADQEKVVLNVDMRGSLKKLRGKRERISVRESDFSADVCKESSTSNGAEIVKSSGVNANLKKDGIKDLMEILDSVLVVNGASAFCRKLDSQKRRRYKETIMHHLDFNTIRSRINKGIIRSRKVLFRDLLLLTNNALVFYSNTTREYKTALLLRDFVTNSLREKYVFRCLSSSVTLPIPNTSCNSAERVSLGAEKANTTDSPLSVEILSTKKAFGGSKNVGRESAAQRHATTLRKEKKRGRAK